MNHIQWVKSPKLFTNRSDTVGATPFVDSGWPHLLKWAQKLQSGWLTHIVDQQTCWCVWRYTTVQFVVSLVLDVTICWFGSIIETTFCTADPFCWQHDVTLSPFVDSGLSSNQHSVQWTHFVDTIMSVIIQYICEKGGQQIETRQSKFLFSDRQDISWKIISPENISQCNTSWENVLFKLYTSVMDSLWYWTL